MSQESDFAIFRFGGSDRDSDASESLSQSQSEPYEDTQKLPKYSFWDQSYEVTCVHMHVKARLCLKTRLVFYKNPGIANATFGKGLFYQDMDKCVAIHFVG